MASSVRRGRYAGTGRLTTTDDPHLDCLLFILDGVPQAERVAWLQRRLPKTAAMLGLRADWEGLADLDAPRVRA